MEAEELKLWELYKKTKRSELLEKLVSKYVNIVHYLANRLHIYSSNIVDRDDLYSAGVIGLMEAIERFDISKGLHFSTYANIRIRGAIIDEIRKTDWVPRSIRIKTRKIDAIINRHFVKTGEFPTDSEIAQKMDITLDEYYRMTDNFGPLFLSSLELPVSQGSDENLKLKDVVADKNLTPMEETLIRKKVRGRLTDAIAKLPKREKLVISLYYYEDLNLKEIGKVMKVSESRVSQIHSSAIAKIKTVIHSDDLFKSF